MSAMTLHFENKVINLHPSDYSVKPIRETLIGKSVNEFRIAIASILIMNIVLFIGRGFQLLLASDLTQCLVHIPLTIDCYCIQLEYYASMTLTDLLVYFIFGIKCRRIYENLR